MGTLAGLVDLADGSGYGGVSKSSGQPVQFTDGIQPTNFKQVITTTSTSETVDITTCTVIRQTASGITTTLSGATSGATIIVKNRGGGSNTLNITVEGTASPTLEDGDSVTLMYNGTDYDIL